MAEELQVCQAEEVLERSAKEVAGEKSKNGKRGRRDRDKLGIDRELRCEALSVHFLKAVHSHWVILLKNIIKTNTNNNNNNNNNNKDEI
jgi:hypothetical protein